MIKFLFKTPIYLNRYIAVYQYLPSKTFLKKIQY